MNTKTILIVSVILVAAGIAYFMNSKSEKAAAAAVKQKAVATAPGTSNTQTDQLVNKVLASNPQLLGAATTLEKLFKI